MNIYIEAAISFFLLVSGVFGLIGSYGLVRLRQTMQRLHAPTKATTVGVGGVLIASMLYFALVEGNYSFHELLITLFLFLTAPITANFVAKTYMARHMHRHELPETGRVHGWSLYDDPPGQNADPEEIRSRESDR